MLQDTHLMSTRVQVYPQLYNSYFQAPKFCLPWVALGGVLKRRPEGAQFAGDNFRLYNSKTTGDINLKFVEEVGIRSCQLT